MIANILTYISTYDDVRAVCGLNMQELPDTTLALATFKHRLGLKLGSISGIYGDSEVNQTLQEIFDAPLLTTDPMYGAIQLYSVYVVADAVLDAVGLRAYKTESDGKSVLTRFSPESAYLGTRQAIRDNISTVLQMIYEYLDIAEEASSYFSVVSPDVDLVIGEE